MASRRNSTSKLCSAIIGLGQVTNSGLGCILLRSKRERPNMRDLRRASGPPRRLIFSSRGPFLKPNDVFVSWRPVLIIDLGVLEERRRSTGVEPSLDLRVSIGK